VNPLSLAELNQRGCRRVNLIHFCLAHHTHSSFNFYFRLITSASNWPHHVQRHWMGPICNAKH